MKHLLIILLILTGFGITLAPTAVYWTVYFPIEIAWQRNVDGRIKRAADSNTVELARQELKAANDYLDSKGLESGNTSLLWAVPENDIGFWRDNLRQAQQTVEEASKSTTTEKEMVLLKLRQTLLDHHEGTETVTRPKFLAYYPYQLPYFLAGIVVAPGIPLGVLAAFFLLCACLYGLVEWRYNRDC